MINDNLKRALNALLLETDAGIVADVRSRIDENISEAVDRARERGAAEIRRLTLQRNDAFDENAALLEACVFTLEWLEQFRNLGGAEPSCQKLETAIAKGVTAR
jgi:hypothetical protein